MLVSYVWFVRRRSWWATLKAFLAIKVIANIVYNENRGTAKNAPQFDIKVLWLAEQLFPFEYQKEKYYEFAHICVIIILLPTFRSLINEYIVILYNEAMMNINGR